MNLQAIGSIVTQIVAAIHSAENLFNEAGQGAAKLAHVKEQAEAAIDGAPFLSDDEKASLKTKVESVVNRLVALLNEFGLLGKVLNNAGLRTDGPTLAQFVAAGYKAENYPPSGYAAKDPAP